MKRSGKSPSSGISCRYQGLALEHFRRFPEAERAYRAGLEKDAVDQRPYYWTQLGLVLAHLGRKSEALEFAEKLTVEEDYRSKNCGLFRR